MRHDGGLQEDLRWPNGRNGRLDQCAARTSSYVSKWGFQLGDSLLATFLRLAARTIPTGWSFVCPHGD